uniref:Uncharacterized protein n=1 Tax=Arundo donax TaxID=35708 RepID=A0A0A9BC46_ARUDO
MKLLSSLFFKVLPCHQSCLRDTLLNKNESSCRARTAASRGLKQRQFWAI